MIRCRTFLLLLAAQRLAELVLARRNTRLLLAEGGVEHGRRHYPLIVALHAGWFAALLRAVPPGAQPNRPCLGLFLTLQAARLWMIASLGRYWTTRIVTVPDAPLVRRGPYRFLRHPNYLIVVGEIALVPLAFGAWRTALIFSALNAAVLRHRVRIENEAIAQREIL